MFPVCYVRERVPSIYTFGTPMPFSTVENQIISSAWHSTQLPASLSQGADRLLLSATSNVRHWCCQSVGKCAKTRSFDQAITIQAGGIPGKGLKSEKNYGGVSRQCPIYQAKPTRHRNVPLSVKSWLRFKPRRYCHDRISTGYLHGWLCLYHFGDIVVILPNCICQGRRRRDRQ